MSTPQKESIPLAWRDFLGNDLVADMDNILARVKRQGEYLPKDNVYAAFSHFSPCSTKVVIVGQDPYHGHGEANGLCFSVNEGVRIPPSLRNIFKELAFDLGHPPNAISPDLTHWAMQGVLLLNCILTVKPNVPAAHKDMGWKECTHKILEKLSCEFPNIVFILWGAYAKQLKKSLSKEARVVEGGHPSPLSANRGGFFGGRYFSKANVLLIEQGLVGIDWINSEK